MVKVISEIGINHNGSIELCKSLMLLSKKAGCDYVKIQKRNPDVCVPEEQKNKPKNTPWGQMTYLEYKHRIEFNEEEIKELFEYSKKIGIELFASVWDCDSVHLMSKYAKIGKIGSACITNITLCKAARKAFDFLIISTGMSTEEEIKQCIQACNPDVIMHTNSTYPTPPEDLNLRYIEWLKKEYPQKMIGYSGHELMLETTFAAVALGATWVERHVTFDKRLWGSDQSSSIEEGELVDLVKGIRNIEKAMQYEPAPRKLFESEKQKKITLRKT